VQCLVTNAGKPALLSKQCHTLADLLSSHDARHGPHVHVNSRLVLAVGACQTIMRHTEDGSAVVAWLQGCVEVGAPPARLHAGTCVATAM